MIHVLVKDLFFKSKIDGIANVLKKKVQFESDIYKIKNPTLILVDLEEFGLEGLQKILEEYPNVKIIGFLSHKRADLIQRTPMLPITVMPRSVFTEKLPNILSEN
ncbi:MAG: hypothetical protein AABX02_04460 [archaeon]